MASNQGENRITHKVVVNVEEQYSIWPAQKTPPSGWREEGASGSKDDCLAYIGRVWTDMRPMSVRSRTETTPTIAS